jgi:NAD(P)-dependent dehydrogenase (short-subunit alcohol dehydrogenase family)
MSLGLCSRSAPALAASERVVAAKLDVSDESAVEAFAAEVVSRFGAIDLWVNNAGVLDPIAPVRDVSVADFRSHIDINLTGLFLGTRTFVRHLRKRGGEGVLINVSSGAAWKPYQGWGVYCAGKAGVERFTEVVAAEEEASGLRAYSIAPGVIDTSMQELIRGCEPDRFPEVDRFREMRANQSFNTGSFVAQHFLAIAFDPGARPDSVAVALPNEHD